MFSFEEQGNALSHWNKTKNPFKFTFPKLGSPKGPNEGPIFWNLGIDPLLKKNSQ